MFKRMRAKTVVISISLLFISVVLAGGGHGTYLPAKIFYPYSMIISELQDVIGFISIILAIIEIPFYAYIWIKKPNWIYYLIVMHLLGIIIVFNLKSNSF
jgi:hypothetical protein